MREDLQKYFQFSPFFVDSKSMPDLDWGKFQDKIDKIPPSLYDLLVDDKTSMFIEALTQKYVQLNTQGAEIARIIRDVILADIYIGDMPAQFSSKLGVDQNTALEIARIIVSQLFAPVIEDIKKLQFQKFGKLPGSSTPQQVSVPRPVSGAELPETGGNIIDLRSKP
jgi:hypothetical protein